MDNAGSAKEAEEWINKLETFLDIAKLNPSPSSAEKHSFVSLNFPKQCQSAINLLPLHGLTYQPLYKLLDGFRTDLQFHGATGAQETRMPIVSSEDLVEYGLRVAGTIGELVLDLANYHHTGSSGSITGLDHLKASAREMGVALQTINIARDVVVDAAIGRVYIPTDWLREEGISFQDVLQNPEDPALLKLRSRLLATAFVLYENNRASLERLPADVRGPMRVAIESYVEIGRVLMTDGFHVKQGRATVPRLRRIRVAWRALRGY